jgi:hypothetical protein
MNDHFYNNGGFLGEGSIKSLTGGAGENKPLDLINVSDSLKIKVRSPTHSHAQSSPFSCTI